MWFVMMAATLRGALLLTVCAQVFEILRLLVDADNPQERDGSAKVVLTVVFPRLLEVMSGFVASAASRAGE
jgi:hypothetical protein